MPIRIESSTWQNGAWKIIKRDMTWLLSCRPWEIDTQLIALAKEINPRAKQREMDMLLTTGEQVSVALMAMAMQAMDVPAVSLNAFQVMMYSTSRYGNARFKRVDTERIRHELDSRKIVIVTRVPGCK